MCFILCDDLVRLRGCLPDWLFLAESDVRPLERIVTILFRSSVLASKEPFHPGYFSRSASKSSICTGSPPTLPKTASRSASVMDTSCLQCLHKKRAREFKAIATSREVDP